MKHDQQRGSHFFVNFKLILNYVICDFNRYFAPSNSTRVIEMSNADIVHTCPIIAKGDGLE